MTQEPPPGGWQDWTATPQPQPYPYPYPQAIGFDPADPLVSNDFNGWWRRSFGLLKAAWRPMVIAQLIIAVPALALLVPGLVLFESAQRTAQESVQASIDTGTMPDFSLYFSGLTTLLPLAALASLFYLIGQLAVVQIVVFTATGRAGNLVGPALLAAVRRLPAMIGWYLLVIPVGIVAVVLCFFPIFYVAAAVMVLPVVVLLERGNGIGRCFRLFHANLGVSVSRIATIFGLSIGASVALSIVTGLISLTVGGSFATPNPTAAVINGLLQGLGTLVSAVVLIPLMVTAYADMRARREPFTTAQLRPEPA